MDCGRDKTSRPVGDGRWKEGRWLVWDIRNDPPIANEDGADSAEGADVSVVGAAGVSVVSLVAGAAGAVAVVDVVVVDATAGVEVAGAAEVAAGVDVDAAGAALGYDRDQFEISRRGNSVNNRQITVCAHLGHHHDDKVFFFDFE